MGAALGRRRTLGSAPAAPLTGGSGRRWTVWLGLGWVRLSPMRLIIHAAVMATGMTVWGCRVQQAKHAPESAESPDAAPPPAASMADGAEPDPGGEARPAQPTPGRWELVPQGPPAEVAHPTGALPGRAGMTPGVLTEIDALEHDLAVGEEKLRAALAKRQEDHPPPPQQRGRRPPQISAPQPAAKPEKKTPSGDAPSPAPEEGTSQEWLGAVGGPCDLACRALGSMRRSGERICALTAPADTRCRRARSRIEDATRRVQEGRCACRAS